MLAQVPCCVSSATPAWTNPARCALQVACEPRSSLSVAVEQYSLGGEGSLRLHLEQVKCLAPAAPSPSLPSWGVTAQNRPCCAQHTPCPPPLQVGGSGSIQALWARTTPATSPATSALEAGLQPDWRKLSNVNGTAAWELRWAAGSCGAQCASCALADSCLPALPVAACRPPRWTCSCTPPTAHPCWQREPCCTAAPNSPPACTTPRPTVCCQCCCRAVIPSGGATGTFSTSLQVAPPKGLSDSSGGGLTALPAAEPAQPLDMVTAPPAPEAASLGSAGSQPFAPAVEAEDPAALKQFELGALGPPTAPPAAEWAIPAAETDSKAATAAVLAPALLAALSDRLEEEEPAAAPMPEQLPAPIFEPAPVPEPPASPAAEPAPMPEQPTYPAAEPAPGGDSVAASATPPAEGQDAAAAGGGGDGSSTSVVGIAAGAGGGVALLVLGELRGGAEC